ncbi:endothelin-converting enzyme homolog [Procambarus clarkii]|uniref:endothelin-converting enzyme homolog n=1 Tax=Procambarus clarkii TaxID=6728 RepID=UPI00374212BE
MGVHDPGPSPTDADSHEHQRPNTRQIPHTVDTTQSGPPTQDSQRPRLGRLASLLPSKFLSFTRDRRQGSATCRVGAVDSEHGRTEKQDRRYPEKWMVGVSIAGVVVSGLVLIIVLFPLLTTTTTSPSPIYSNRSQHPKYSAGELFQSNTIREDEANLQEILESPDYELRPSFKKPSDPSPDLHDFYSYVVDNIRGAMNLSVPPCDDFYQYACGNWKEQHPPPKGVSSWSNFEAMTVRIWDMMEEELEAFMNNSDKNVNYKTNLQTVFDEPLTKSRLNKADTFVWKLVTDYYASCENETNLALLGVGPLQDVLHQMDQEYQRIKLQSQPLEAFQRILEYVHYDLAIHAFFSWKVETDNTIANAMAIELTTPSVDLVPQGTVVRGNDELITVYKQYASDILEMVGTFANNSVENEVHIILELLQIHQPVGGSLLVNDTNIEELNSVAPFLDWQKYFNKGFNNVGTFITINERILSLIQDYLAAISIEIMEEISHNGSDRLYIFLRWQVVQYYSQFLHKEARNTVLPLFDIITGEDATALPKFRFRPCIKELEERLPLPIAYLLMEIIKEQLQQGPTIHSMIKKVEQMADNIRNEYVSYIDSFKWLNSKAKSVLVEKLRNVNILVGYPPILDDMFELHSLFENLNFNKKNLLHNQINLLKFNQNQQMRFLRQPGAYSEWEILSPMSLISFYVYRRNTLLIPLGGFMYPLYNSDLPETLSYATMGTFISHELGHAIDFVGRTRDLYGRANATMWDEQTVVDFVEKVLCRINQYTENYYPIQGLLTIAEVMADDGSIGNAYRTIQSKLPNTKLPSSISELLTELHLSPDQLFFLQYAQLFCAASINGIPPKGVAHYPPHSVRVRATLSNTPDFQRVFACDEDTKMNTIKDKCDIW